MHARSRTPRNGSVPGGTGWETDGTRAKRGKHLEILRERGGNAELIYSVAHYPRAGWWPVQALLPVKETTHRRPQRNKRQSHYQPLALNQRLRGPFANGSRCNRGSGAHVVNALKALCRSATWKRMKMHIFRVLASSSGGFRRNVSRFCPQIRALAPIMSSERNVPGQTAPHLGYPHGML